MKLYVDLETLQLIEGPGFRNPVTTLRFKRGDAAKLEVAFLDGGSSAVAIGDPVALEVRFGIKPRNRYDVGYLVHDAVWTMPAVDAENPLYQCSPSFNTEQLDSALGVGSSTGSELAEITLMGEITWREGSGEPTSTRTFLVVVENDVNRGTEGVPLSAEPPYPAPQNLVTTDNLGDKAVRHDITQSLTTTQKNRARGNIGAVADSDSRLSDARTPTAHSHSPNDVTGLEAALNERPKLVAQAPDSTTEPLPTIYPILFVSGAEVWLLPAGQIAGSAIQLTGVGGSGQIVMEWQITEGMETSLPDNQILPAGNYAFALAITDLVPVEESTTSGFLINLSEWNYSSYSNVVGGGAMGQFSMFSMPLQLYVSFDPFSPNQLTGTADLTIDGESTVSINFIEGAPLTYRLILTFTPI